MRESMTMNVPEIVISTVDGFDVYPDQGIIRKQGHTKNYGSKDRDGYVTFWHSRKKTYQRAHRYIFEVYHGITLTHEQKINHINHKVDDNRIDNLETLSNQQNIQWQKLSPRNKSGFKGVFHRDGYWIASIHFNKSIYLGQYRTKEQAAVAYNRKALELNETNDCRYTLNDVDMETPMPCREIKTTTGVYWNKQQKKWASKIRHNRICYFLGYFVNKDDALRAYNFKAKELNEKEGCNYKLNIV